MELNAQLGETAPRAQDVAMPTNVVLVATPSDHQPALLCPDMVSNANEATVVGACGAMATALRHLAYPLPAAAQDTAWAMAVEACSCRSTPEVCHRLYQGWDRTHRRTRK